MAKSVTPLESNPLIFTNLAHTLGLTPLLKFFDIYSLTEKELLEFLPSPIYGIILLFPLENYPEEQVLSADVNWYKQELINGCGLYALLHIILNLPPNLIINGSLLHKFKQFGDIESLVQTVDDTFSGNTSIPDQVNYHYTTFIKKGLELYELDGRRQGPIHLGSSPSPLIEDENLLNRVQFYMNSASEGNENGFALMGIAPLID